MIWQLLHGLWGERLAPPPPSPEPVGTAPSDPVALGRAAAVVLQDPVMRLALDRVERRLIDTWRMSAVGAYQEREAAYALHSAVQELRAELQRMMVDGRRRQADTTEIN